MDCQIKEFSVPQFGLGLSEKKKQEFKDFCFESELRGFKQYERIAKTPYGDVKIYGFYSRPMKRKVLREAAPKGTEERA